MQAPRPGGAGQGQVIAGRRQEGHRGKSRWSRIRSRRTVRRTAQNSAAPNLRGTPIWRYPHAAFLVRDPGAGFSRPRRGGLPA